MVLLILSKGAQRRKNGEKRKDRKKEATEEKKGCSEKEKLVICRFEMDRSARPLLLYLPALCKFALSLLPSRPPAFCAGAQTSVEEQRSCGHTGSCLYVHFKALPGLLSYEESRCAETGVRSGTRRLCSGL